MSQQLPCALVEGTDTEIKPCIQIQLLFLCFSTVTEEAVLLSGHVGFIGSLQCCRLKSVPAPWLLYPTVTFHLSVLTGRKDKVFLQDERCILFFLLMQTHVTHVSLTQGAAERSSFA